MTTTSGALDPREQDIYTLDFTPLLNAGETLASIVAVSVSVVRGADPNPSAFLPASPVPAINQQPVTVKTPQILSGVQQTTTIAAGCCIQGPMGGGVDGAWYEIAGEAQTTNSLRRLVCKLIVPVSAS
jgi:hypothetical protein